MKGEGQVVSLPRKQAWATWLLCAGPWCFGLAILLWANGPAGVTNHEWFVWGLLVMAGLVILSPFPWFLLRRIPVFRVPHRIHAVQMSIWFSGVAGVPALAGLGAAMNWW